MERLKTLPEYLNSIEDKLDTLISLMEKPEKKVITENNNKQIEYRDADTKQTTKGRKKAEK